MELAQKLFSTRGGTLILAGMAAVLAVVVVLVYVHNYKSSVRSSGAPATVLVARSLIPKGTPGTQVAQSHLFQAATIRQSQLQNGALSDASSLAGKVAAVDIFPGQQLTSTEFIASSGAIAGSLAGAERAITLPLDAAHGLIGTVRAGDQVDIYAGFNIAPVDANGNPVGSGGRPVLRLIASAVPVLAAGGSGKGGVGSSGVVNVTLRADPELAAELAFASDNGKIWLTLRPPVGATASPPDLVTAETILLGISPIKELKALGGRR